MLNQLAVEIPTLPVDQCHSHLIRYLQECCDSLSHRRAAEKGRQAFGTHMVYRETFLQIQMRLHQLLILKNCINGSRPKSRSIRPQWIRFKTEVCTCSQFPTEAMQWIKEVELVDSVDELRSSSSIRGISMPNFEVLDARIASALNKIIHNSHFKRKISLEEQKAQKEDRFLRGRQRLPT